MKKSLDNTNLRSNMKAKSVIDVPRNSLMASKQKSISSKSPHVIVPTYSALTPSTVEREAKPQRQQPSLESKSPPWDEDILENKITPEAYLYKDAIPAMLDLLKSILTNPMRAMQFPLWIYFSLFLVTLTAFSSIHSILVIMTAHFVTREVSTFLTGMSRIFSATIIAILIALPGVVMLWVMTPRLTFESTFKRFLLYYQTVILFSLLGELFFAKFIIDSSMKLQPLVILLAGTLAIHTLQRALEYEPNIKITRTLIVAILTLSYLQAFLIVDSLIPYYLQDNIDSPFTQIIRQLFHMLFH